VFVAICLFMMPPRGLTVVLPLALSSGPVVREQKRRDRRQQAVFVLTTSTVALYQYQYQYGSKVAQHDPQHGSNQSHAQPRCPRDQQIRDFDTARPAHWRDGAAPLDSNSAQTWASSRHQALSVSKGLKTWVLKLRDPEPYEDYNVYSSVRCTKYQTLMAAAGLSTTSSPDWPRVVSSS
jgi:hypothetical protein